MNGEWEKDKFFGLGFLTGVVFTCLFGLFLYIVFV